MAVAPDIALAAAIAGNLGLTVGVEVFNGPKRPRDDGVPDKAVFIVPTGGPAPEAFNGETVVLERPNYNVIVRAPAGPSGYLDGLDFARDVRNALHYAALTIAGALNAIESRALVSDPLYISKEDEGDHLWSIPVEIWLEQDQA